VLEDCRNAPCWEHPVFARRQAAQPAPLSPPPCDHPGASQVAKAPDGNGGLYRALHVSGALAAMQAAGVEALDVYCVDNSLARLGDPEFVGCCYARGTQVGGRCTRAIRTRGLVGRRGENIAEASGTSRRLISQRTVRGRDC
jgi:hypothetical protein